MRYADDWVIGVWGPSKLCLSIRDTVQSFLKGMKLELSLEKTFITSISQDRAHFLGVEIGRSKMKKMIRLRNGKKRRAPSGNIMLYAPIEKLLRKLEKRKFIDNFPAFRGISVPKFVTLPLKDMIIRYRVILKSRVPSITSFKS